MKQLEQMVAPTRFLVRNIDTGDWIEADHKTAYNKTTQTLRQIPKHESRKTSLPLPQNKLSITIQGSQRDHQELLQHPEVGHQEAINSTLNHPYMDIASATKADNSIHPEKQHCDNMIESTQGPCTSPGEKRNICFQQESVNSGSTTTLFRSPVKHIDACKNTNKNYISVGEDIPVPVVANHSEEIQETISAEDNTSMTFTSDEVEYLSKAFLDDNHQHNNAKQKRKSSSSRPAVQGHQEHSFLPSSRKKRQRITNAEPTTHVQKCHDNQEVNDAVTNQDTVVLEDLAVYVELLAKYIFGESATCCMYNDIECPK